MGLILGGMLPAAAGGGGPPVGNGFINLRDVGTEYISITDGTASQALAKPSRIAGDLLIVIGYGTFIQGTSPTENPGPWNVIRATGTIQMWWRIATGDANDDFTVAEQAGSGVCVMQMMSFDLSDGPYTSVSGVQGGALAENNSSFTTQFPTAFQGAYANDQTLGIHWYFKSQNNRGNPTGLADNLVTSPAILAADEFGTGQLNWAMGLGGNPAGNRTSWWGWTYDIFNGVRSGTIPSVDQTESPESSGFEVVSHYAYRFRITF
jgi:hypothetical protein